MIGPRGFEVRAFGLAPRAQQRRGRFAGWSSDDELDLDMRDADKRAATESAGWLAGYAVPWNSTSQEIDGFFEEFRPGAFRRSLAGSRDIRALWAHDTTAPLGRRANGTLRVFEDSHGLGFESDLPRTELGLDTMRLVRRRDVTGVSFGFAVPEGGDTWSKRGGQILRTVHEANLFEISPVLWPAYEATSLSEGSHRAHRLRMLEDDPTARRARLQAREESEARRRRLRLLERSA